MGSIIRIVLVDHPKLTLSSLAQIIGQQDGFTVVGTFYTPTELLCYLEKNTVDIVLVNQKILNHYESHLFLQIKASRSNIKLLVISNTEAGSSNLDFYNNIDADGFLFKDTEIALLLDGIKKIVNGIRILPQNKTENILMDKKYSSPSPSKLPYLTSREKEILVLIAEGFSSKEIGIKLFISCRTVETHRCNMMKKLDANNIACMLKIAFQSSLLN